MEISSQAQIPLGNGNVLNLPVEMEDGMEDYEFGADQRAKLELLHKNLGQMLKIKAQTMEEDD